MANIYNTLVSMKDRAQILVLSSDTDKASFDGLDAIFPRIGGMDASTQKLFRDISLDKWLTQADKVGIPSVPYYLLDAAYWLNGNGTNESTVDNMAQADNPILRDIINSLHAGGWTFDTLDATIGWKKFNGISLMIYNNKTAIGGDISGQWQVSTIDNVLKQLISLKNAKKFPDVKIILWSNPDWLEQYSVVDPLYTYLSKKKVDTFLGISNFIYSGIGPKVDNIQLVFDTYQPNDDYKFPFRPEAYDSSGTNSHVVFHGFTADRFTVPQVLNLSGTPQPLELVLWCDTKDVMYKTLNFVPSVVIPPVNTDLELRVKALEDLKDEIKTALTGWST